MFITIKNACVCIVIRNSWDTVFWTLVCPQKCPFFEHWCVQILSGSFRFVYTVRNGWDNTGSTSSDFSRLQIPADPFSLIHKTAMMQNRKVRDFLEWDNTGSTLFQKCVSHRGCPLLRLLFTFYVSWPRTQTPGSRIIWHSSLHLNLSYVTWAYLT